MIKVTKILLILLCSLFLLKSQAQRIKYCFLQSSRWNGKIYTPKQQVFDLLKNDTDRPTCDLRNKISLFGGDTIYVDSTALLLPDSIEGVFTITSISERKENYTIKNNRLVRKSIYCIDIACQDRQYAPSHIQILSIERNIHKGKKIKIGDKLKMTIFPFFKEDSFTYEENGKIIYGLPSLQAQTCFLLEDIWVVYFPLGYRNYFETPNLKGLYYVPN
jgi:hypothetical protein